MHRCATGTGAALHGLLRSSPVQRVFSARRAGGFSDGLDRESSADMDFFLAGGRSDRRAMCVFVDSAVVTGTALPASPLI